MSWKDMGQKQAEGLAQIEILDSDEELSWRIVSVLYCSMTPCPPAFTARCGETAALDLTFVLWDHLA